MTDQEINIAIGISQGWTREDAIRGHSLSQFSENLPSYTTDLNAMHEAEKVLNHPEQMRHHAWNNYHNRLETTTGGSQFHATAPQRAEAYLRTLSLWKE